jgi:hypothetical protein
MNSLGKPKQERRIGYEIAEPAVRKAKQDRRVDPQRLSRTSDFLRAQFGELGAARN